MKNESNWKPTKYVYHKNRLRASRDEEEVDLTSRLVADLVAALYDKHLKVHARGRLLDLGCGKVPLYQTYRPHIDSCTCVEWANTGKGMDHIDVVCDLTKTLPFDNGSFDTIILSDVLEHLPNPKNCWEEMGRILSEGGKVMMNVPFLYGLHEKPFDFYRYTEFALQKFAEDAGFYVELLVPVGGAPETLANMVAKNIRRLRWGGRSLAKAVHGLTAWFISTRYGKKIAAQTAENYPLGYFMVARKKDDTRS